MNGERTLADDLRAEEEQLTRRFLAYSIRGKVLTMEEANAVCRKMEESIEREKGIGGRNLSKAGEE